MKELSANQELQVHTVHKWSRGQWEELSETVSPEEPLTLLYPGGQTTLWAWPEDLPHLCLGHVLLDYLPEAPRLRPDGQCLWDVQDISDSTGRRFTVYPRQSLPDRKAACSAPANVPHLKAAAIPELMHTFLHLEGACPQLWEATGCFHRAGLYDPQEGRFLRLAEDIGRHNCLDRLLGWLCLNGRNPASLVLFLSARITASLFAKARRAGFATLISRSAVTTAPLTLSSGEDVVVIGFCRPQEERFTVFQDPQGRIA